jgi:hypothetical protein
VGPPVAYIEEDAMADDAAPLAYKLANALIPEALPASAIAKMGLNPALDVIERFRHSQGGLWVGGTVSLFGDRLDFRPNAVNRAAHQNDTSVSVPLSAIADVTDRFGWVTRIVDVRMEGGGVFSFRCFGAKRFAEAIRRQAATEQPG